jgi:cytochrome c peroxidase
MLSDGDAGFTKAVGMAYSVPATGFYDRSRRYVMVIEDGTVTHFQQDVPGTCALSTGEAILEVL